MNSETTIRRLLAIIAVLLILAALKWSKVVTMPLGFAVFLVALFWPIKRWCDRRMPSALGSSATILAFFVIVAVFMSGIYYAVIIIAENAPRYSDEARSAYEGVTGWAQRRGVPIPDAEQVGSQLVSVAQVVLSQAYSALGLGGLVAALFILGLPEVPKYREKIRRYPSFASQGRLVETLVKIAHSFQSYVAVISLTSAITGILTGLLCWVVGLDLAFVWGLMGYVLNYIPTIGSVIAVIPPTLFAFLQFDGLLMPMVVLIGLSVMQLAMGNLIYPKVQGRSLKISAFVILFGLTFWGWIWGIVGALLSTPITAAIIIACGRFSQTRWIAALLTDEVPDDDTEDQHPPSDEDRP